eukprot:s2197_g4.t1
MRLSIAPESQSLLELGEVLMIVALNSKERQCSWRTCYQLPDPSLQASCWGTLCRAPRLRLPPVRALPCTDELASSPAKYRDTDSLVAFICHPADRLIWPFSLSRPSEPSRAGDEAQRRICLHLAAASASKMLRSATAGQALASDFLRLEAQRDVLEGKQWQCLEDMENRKLVNQQRQKAYADILDRRLRVEGKQQSVTKERNLVIRTEATKLCSGRAEGEAINHIRARKERFGVEVEQMWKDWQQRVAAKIREDIEVARRDAEHCKARQQEAMEGKVAFVVVQAMPDKDVPLTAVVGAAAAASAVDQRSKKAGLAATWTKPVVIASPALEPLAKEVRKRLGEDEYPEWAGPTVNLEYFKSKDPNVKFNWKRVVGRKIVFLFDTALQGFAVPDGEDKGTKWKTYVNAGAYSWGRASQITVVIPWYRPCQMLGSEDKVI